jgi:hypothetical protein
MRPGDDVLTALNAKSEGARPPADGPTYYALASDYTPDPVKAPAAALALNFAMDKVFGAAPNDLLVPAKSVYEASAFPYFQISEKLVLDGEGSTSHLEYFASPIVRDQIHKWLAI